MVTQGRLAFGNCVTQRLGAALTSSCLVPSGRLSSLLTLATNSLESRSTWRTAAASPPHTGCFSARSLPQNGSLAGSWTAVPARKRGWHRLSNSTCWTLLHTLLKPGGDCACLRTAHCPHTACSCSWFSWSSHFYEKRGRPQPTANAFAHFVV